MLVVATGHLVQSRNADSSLKFRLTVACRHCPDLADFGDLSYVIDEIWFLAPDCHERRSHKDVPPPSRLIAAA